MQQQIKKERLRQAQMRQAQMRQARMRQVRMRQAQMRQAQMRQAQMRQAQMRQGEMIQAQMRQAQMRQAQMRQAQMRQAQVIQEKTRYEQDKIRKIDNFNKLPLKVQHRTICLSKLPIIRNIIIDCFGDDTNSKETILIEFRPLPHLEFLLRNTIIKLNNWNHTIVCGNKNYAMCYEICENIHKILKNKIKIMKLDIDNLTPSEYSQLLMTKDFWNRFVGEKLLVYQEDTMLFHGNITPFLKYDYVGAPWQINQDDNSYGVGNGGFSLRTKSKMLECIDKIDPKNLKLGKSTIDYMNNTKSTFIPEDVYFSKAMIDNNIGVVATRDIATEFSQETQKSINPLGGHNYWLADNNIIKNTNNFERIGFYSPYNYIIGGGENYISKLIKFFIKCGAKEIHFYNDTNEYVFNKTIKIYFTPYEIAFIKQKHTRELFYAIKYDYFVEMGNYQYPRMSEKNISKIFIYHCQFPFDHYDNRVNIKQLDNVDHIILNSDYTKKYYIKKMHEKDIIKLKINYPVCFQEQSHNTEKKETNTFVMIGRIHKPNHGAHNKCHVDIIKIFRKLISCNTAFKLFILGTIQDLDYYKYLKSLEIKDRINIIGNCPEEKKNEIISKCQYHIHSTGINLNEETDCFKFEHFGISTIECINKGCIPICVNGGFFPYYIKHQKNGFLFRTSKELNNILEQILKSKTNLISFEEANKINRNIIRKFSERNFFDRFAKILL